MPGRIHARFTDTGDGDLAIGSEPAGLAARRAAIAPHLWSWLSQVHGPRVVTVEHPGQHAGTDADAAVTAVPGAALAVQTADCAPVLLQGDGVVGVAHAGWRGLHAGVIEATVEAMAALGATSVRAVLGPCIRARCYEFDGPELDLVAERYGPSVRAATAWGTPALDVAGGVAAACAQLGVPFTDLGTCTACSPVHWSFRARADTARQAVVAWIEP
ncbi:laccase domain-containing protein [Aquihabitans sp. McL0605]|uniref:laccase domain-containing protein n=1 Tax=Aquihabitans sp. McL0605 TaxID=3415671 RepID=UPI003CED1919